jgi:predicted tellurium resistance membrane protein TerC
MKKQQLQSITAIPESPDAERRARMIKYTVAMVIRIICFALIFAVPGWWRLIPALGAVALPYVAVVLANVRSSGGEQVVSPEGGLSIDAPRTKADDAS